MLHILAWGIIFLVVAILLLSIRAGRRAPENGPIHLPATTYRRRAF